MLPTGSKLTWVYSRGSYHESGDVFPRVCERAAGIAPLLTSGEVRAGKVVREGEVVVADLEGRPIHLAPGSNLVQRRTSAVSVFQFVEKRLLHAIVLALRHTGKPEPHRTL